MPIEMRCNLYSAWKLSVSLHSIALFFLLFFLCAFFEWFVWISINCIYITTHIQLEKIKRKRLVKKCFFEIMVYILSLQYRLRNKPSYNVNTSWPYQISTIICTCCFSYTFLKCFLSSIIAVHSLHFFRQWEK